MKSFASRHLALLLVSLLTTASINVAYAGNDEPPVDDLVQAFRTLDQSISNGQLQQAESQLGSLRQRAAGDTRLEQYQRQLADNYLQQGQSAVQKGDLNAATAALTHARNLLPQAPAMASDLDTAIASARAKAEAEKAQAAAQQAAAKEAAAKAEQARQQKLAAEHLAAQKAAASQAAAAAAAAAVPVAPQAKLIKPAAASSTIALPMLEEQDNDGLRTLLDGVASDVVNFHCNVSIEVQKAKDYPWVAALLTARVKKLDPAFNLQLNQVLNPQKAAQLVLTPQRQG